ncbi:All-trans-phytoene synthase [Rosistilla carotiformis]|uniref:All-trans-phytoene synthase n=1 Tax=Rosistilla carotiformis TaxID=2528017 RepID=A0A518JNH4_9BACT|nr:phytoene/squalene synthase family protein [Rosistilla carotiformis]QDV67102.1 All-trans-phytoene synthase [Rosistilla carotiformis]
MNNAPASINASYAVAARVARQAASSFYPSFWLLPRAKRQAMCAFYAFARLTDDAADAAGEIAGKRRWLDAWRQTIEATFAGDLIPPASTLHSAGPESRKRSELAMQILPALQHAQKRYAIDPTLLLEIIDGALADQLDRSITTQQELDTYCYQVASTVGLVCLQIWEFHGEATRQAAIDCGKAFQLTNILRDVREDLQRGRCYLPQSDLQRFGVDPQRPTDDQQAAWLELLSYYGDRAESYYQQGWLAWDGIHADGRPMFSMMWHSYHALLKKIRQQPLQVLQRRVRLTWRQKMNIAASHFVPGYPRRLAVVSPRRDQEG